MVALSALAGSWAGGIIALGISLTLPGVLLLRALRVSAAAVEAFPFYIPVAALLVLMVGGLLSDLVGPLLGVSRPLIGRPQVIGVAATCVFLLAAGARHPDAARFRWRRMLAAPSLLLLLSVPALAAAGALLLNNGSGPTVARIATVAAITLFAATLLTARRVSAARLGTALFATALAVEWSFSLRSHYVIGFDISSEFHIAQATHIAGIWHAGDATNAYDAMLSLTVLPSTLSALTGCSPLCALKVVYPALAALIPVSVYCVAARYVSRPFAVAAAGLILVQNYFFEGLPTLARQELGLLFFAALMAAIDDKFLSTPLRTRVAVTFAFGLVLSHYSSAYIAIALIATAVLLEVLLLPLRHKAAGRLLPLVSAGMALVVGAVLWYGPVTHSESNASGFVSALTHHGLDLLPTQGQRGLVANYLGGNVVTSVSGARFQALAVRDYTRRSTYIHPLPAATDPRYAVRTASVPRPPVRFHLAAGLVSAIVALFGQLMLVLAVVGAIGVIVRRSSSGRAWQLAVISLACVPVLVFLRFSGTAAEAYNQVRALLQALIVLAVPAAWAGQYLWRRFPGLRQVAPLIATVGYVVVFAFNSGSSAVLLGGGTSLNVSQSGEDFERLYVYRPELAAATWANNASSDQLLYADRYGQLRLFQATGRLALTNIIPQTLDRDAWIYATTTNIVDGRARGQIGSSDATYRWPAGFLSTYYNTVFTDGSSAVYHG